MFCLDEADEMLEIVFRQIIENILKKIQRDSKHNIQILMFSATFTEDIIKIAQRYLSPSYIKKDLL